MKPFIVYLFLMPIRQHINTENTEKDFKHIYTENTLKYYKYIVL